MSSLHSTLTQTGEPTLQGGARAGPYLYRVLDCDRPLEPSSRHALGGLEAVELGRDEAAAVRRQEGSCGSLRLGIPDRWMSSRHARLQKVLGRWVVEDTQSKNGLRVNGEKVQRAELVEGDVLELGHTFLLYRAAQLYPEPAAGVPLDLRSDELGAPVPALRTLVPGLGASFGQLATVAASLVSVVVEGESGTGKELVARALHQLSGRSGAFVAVNCGALPSELVESELFGHKQGAFSGAHEDRSGLVRAAHHGTLFLDEIGDLPLPAQPALLRVLQEREVLPVGGTRPVPVDLRVVCATHRSLEELVEQARFREDLLSRLTGFRLELPPLFARREDLGILVAELLRKVAGERAAGIRFSPEAARALLAWSWPMNVRELEKCLEAAAVLATTGLVELPHLPEPVRAGPGRARPTLQQERQQEDVRRKEELVALLTEHQGNVSAVARAMGKARMQVQRWMARYGLDSRDFRRDE